MSETEAAPKKKLSRFITPTLVLIAVLAVGVVGGVVIGQNTASAAGPGGIAQGQFPGGDAAGGTAPTGMGDFTSGTIVSVEGSTVVLELEDGSQVTVNTATDTTVTKTTDATVSDLAAGEEVTVIGAADDDGTVTATSISQGARGFGGGGTRPTTGAGTDTSTDD